MPSEEVNKRLDLLARRLTGEPDAGTELRLKEQYITAIQDLGRLGSTREDKILKQLDAIVLADRETALQAAAVNAMITLFKREADNKDTEWKALAKRLKDWLANESPEVYEQAAGALAELAPVIQAALPVDDKQALADLMVALWTRLGMADPQSNASQPLARAIVVLWPCLNDKAGGDGQGKPNAEANREAPLLTEAIEKLASPDPQVRCAAIAFLKTDSGWHLLMRAENRDQVIHDLLTAYRAVSTRGLLADIVSLVIDMTSGYPDLFRLFLPDVKVPAFIFKLDTRSEYGNADPALPSDPAAATARPGRSADTHMIRWKQTLFLVDPRVRTFINENILKRRVRLELKNGVEKWYQDVCISELKDQPPGANARVKIVDRSPHSSWFQVETENVRGWIDATTELKPVMFDLVDESQLQEGETQQVLECRYKILSLMLGELRDSERDVRQNMISWLRECDPYFIPKERLLVANALWECMLQYGQGLRAYGVINLRNEEDAMKEAVRELVYSNVDQRVTRAIGGLLLKEGGRELDDLYEKPQSQEEEELARSGNCEDPGTAGRPAAPARGETEEKPKTEHFPHKDRIMPFIMGALESSDEQICQLALVWVYRRGSGSKAQDYIPGPFIRDLLTRLRRLAEDDISPNLRRMARNALIPITEQHSKFLFTQFDRKGALAIDIINELVEMQSPAVMSSLIRQWGYWIAETDKSQLVEATAVELRSNMSAILPLVERLRQPLQLTNHEEVLLKNEILEQKVEQVVADRLLDDDHEFWLSAREKKWLRKYKKAAVDSTPSTPPATRSDGTSGRGKGTSPEDPLDVWIRSLAEDGGRFRELEQTAVDQGWGAEKRRKEFARLFWEKELEQRELLVRRRVALQLAEMSSPRFFETPEHKEGIHHPTYLGIKAELKKHAVPYLAHKLPEEPDLRVREHLARTLANVGELEAVDALALAVVAEDRVKENRRQVLADYYLEPSKRRSEQAARILEEAVDQAEHTMRLIQILSVATFILGVAIVVTGLYLAATATQQAQQFFGIFASIGGVAGIITLLIKGPLNDIQNSIANLVQLETAFTNFIWELNLNSTYIQSQYVEKGLIANDVVASTIDRMESAMSTAMNVIALYMEEGHQKAFAHINAVLPGAGEPGVQVKLLGHYLKVQDGQKQDPREKIMVAIDHRRTDVVITSWEKDHVTFWLPKTGLLPAGQGERSIWISLLVDGIETNAILFIVKEQSVQAVPEAASPALPEPAFQAVPVTGMAADQAGPLAAAGSDPQVNVPTAG